MREDVATTPPCASCALSPPKPLIGSLPKDKDSSQALLQSPRL